VSASNRWLVALLALASVGAAAFFIAELPGLNSRPGWFYRAEQTGSLFSALAVILAALAPFAIRAALRAADAGRHARALLALVLVGGLMQVALLALAPRQFDAAWRRLHDGHGEYLRIANARRGHALETLRDYESLCERGTLGSFARSKPPGTLAVYLALDRLGEAKPVRTLLAPLVERARRSQVAAVAHAASLAFVLFPLLTFLPVIPLVLLARALLHDARAGYDAAVLWVCSPAALLITLHLDGALFPLVGTGAVALAAIGARRGAPLASLAGGVVAALGAYCTFGLLPVVGLGVGCALVVAAEQRAHHQPLPLAARPLVQALLFLAGAAATTAVLAITLRYAPLARYEHALALHGEWKAFVPTRAWRVLSLVEFALYAGIPLALAYLVELLRATLSVARRELVAPSAWTLGTAATLGALAFFQGTNEVARLWMFMIPFGSLAIAAGLRARSADDPRAAVLPALALAQALLAVIMKVTQPW
jgi:hypothetical protein